MPWLVSAMHAASVIQPTIFLEITIALHGVTHCICYPTYHLFLKLHCTYRLGVFNFNLDFFKQAHILWFLSIRPRGFYLSEFTGLAFPQQLKGNRMLDIFWADLYQ